MCDIWYLYELTGLISVPPTILMWESSDLSTPHLHPFVGVFAALVAVEVVKVVEIGVILVVV